MKYNENECVFCSLQSPFCYWLDSVLKLQGKKKNEKKEE